MSFKFEIIGYKNGAGTKLYGGGGNMTAAMSIGAQYAKNRAGKFDIIQVVRKDTGELVASF